MTPALPSLATPPELIADIDRWRQRALIAGVAGLALCAVGWFLDPTQFYRSYLVAFILWNGLTLGCLAVAFLHQLSGGAWGTVSRRILEAGTRLFPVTLLFFLPLLFGIHSLYIWSNPAVVAADKALRHKAPYLNVGFFIARAAAYFIIWNALSYFFNKWSLAQDGSSPEPWTVKLERISGPGLLLYGATVTFSSIDWVMSLEPHWYSTIWGILFLGGQGVASFSFVIAVIVLLSSRPPMSEVITGRHLRDLGTLLFAFIMLWAYFNFSQFLLIWAGNLPEEIPYYVARMNGPWMWIGLFLVVFHFAVPFLLLLSRDLKRNAKLIRNVALWVFVLRLVDLFWIAGPFFDKGAFHIHWLDLAAPVGLGGVWISAFFWQLKQRPLFPLHDPILEEVLVNGRN
jgi:hypothetical protein